MPQGGAASLYFGTCRLMIVTLVSRSMSLAEAWHAHKSAVRSERLLRSAAKTLARFCRRASAWHRHVKFSAALAVCAKHLLPMLCRWRIWRVQHKVAIILSWLNDIQRMGRLRVAIKIFIRRGTHHRLVSLVAAVVAPNSHKVMLLHLRSQARAETIQGTHGYGGIAGARARDNVGQVGRCSVRSVVCAILWSLASRQHTSACSRAADRPMR